MFSFYFPFVVRMKCVFFVHYRENYYYYDNKEKHIKYPIPMLYLPLVEPVVCRLARTIYM